MLWRVAWRRVLPTPIALAGRREWIARRIARGGAGYYDWDIQLLPALVKPGDVCWDIGANAGAYTLPLARLARAVYAFEPVRHNRQILERALSLARISNVSVLPLALSDRRGAARMSVPVDGFYGGFMMAALDAEGDVEVEQTTIDQLIESGLPAPDFIKCDVEGAEGRVLDGARGLLVRRRPILLLETFEEAIFQRVRALGYQAHVYVGDLKMNVVTSRTEARNYIFLPESGAASASPG